MSDVFAAALAGRLRGEVADDEGTRAAYSFDASNHRVRPRCVAFPAAVDDVGAIVEVCRSEGVPVTSRGGGTSIAGSALGSGVVVDFSRHLDRVHTVDPEAGTAVVDPGVVLDDLQRAASRHGLRFGPDPSSHDRCTIGGMLGTNACGSHSLAWGTTADSTRGLDVVLPDGSMASWSSGVAESSGVTAGLVGLVDRWRADIEAELGRFSRQGSGYGLHHLVTGAVPDVAKALVGSEGTCAIVTRATLDLVPLPERRGLLVVGFPDLVAAAAASAGLARLGVLTVEGFGADLVAAYDSRPGPHDRPDLPHGAAWLLVEVGGSADDVAEGARQVAAEVAGAATGVSRLDDRAEQAAVWRIREKGAGLATRSPDGVEFWAGWEDAAVPVAGLPAYLGDFQELLSAHGRRGVLYGHFGEGCVHVRIDHDLLSTGGRRAYADFQRDAADLVVRHGGSLSGEHGDGRTRSGLLARMYSPAVIEAFAAFKQTFDPGNLLNPGVLVDPAPIDGALRAEHSRPVVAGLGFRYPDDGGDLGRALRRCAGVGACRSDSGGMCPSFRATDDERHSTRGRARILAEMLSGEAPADGWQSDAAAEALDLCLMCKACRSECPVAVDMATYKAEFLHQRYRRRPRPRSHYSLGWLPVWLGAARRMPRVTNRALARPRSSRLLKRVGGIDPGRDLPPLATARHDGQPAISADGKGDGEGVGVVVWADTFTRSFAPEVVEDAAAVCRAAGLAVELVGPGLCCGLTWVSTGQLGVAKRAMRRTLARLDDGGTRPIVVLEPSCASALREDTVALLGTDAARRVASRVVGLAEVLVDRRLPAVTAAAGSSVLAQFHCHQRATVGVGADRALLAGLGLRVTTVDEGCCGLAGNFGFEAGHLAVSVACAEQSFLPYLVADPDAVVLADGFSCRLQMEQIGGQALAGRRPLHLAQLLRRLLEPA